MYEAIAIMAVLAVSVPEEPNENNKQIRVSDDVQVSPFSGGTGETSA